MQDTEFTSGMHETAKPRTVSVSLSHPYPRPLPCCSPAPTATPCRDGIQLATTQGRRVAEHDDASGRDIGCSADRIPQEPMGEKTTGTGTVSAPPSPLPKPPIACTI